MEGKLARRLATLALVTATSAAACPSPATKESPTPLPRPTTISTPGEMPPCGANPKDALEKRCVREEEQRSNSPTVIFPSSR